MMRRSVISCAAAAAVLAGADAVVAEDDSATQLRPAIASPYRVVTTTSDVSGAQPITIDGNTLDPAIQRLLAARQAHGESGLVVDNDPVATRAHMEETPDELARARTQFPVNVDDLMIAGATGPLHARHYRPPGSPPAPLLVFYHGGGFVYGDLDLYDPLARRICQDAGVHVLSIDYRLAPEHKAPAAVEDAYAAFRWATAHAGELQALPDRIAVGGDSAGGTLAAVVSRLARDDGGPLPALQWLAYPLTDAGAKTPSRALFANGFLLTDHDLNWFNDEYLGGSDVALTDPRVSPLLAANLAGLPPAVLITAGFDPLRDEDTEYADALRSAGVEVDVRKMPSLIHAFLNLGSLGGATEQAISEAIAALRGHLNDK
jgi:acetyl esterase